MGFDKLCHQKKLGSTALIRGRPFTRAHGRMIGVAAQKNISPFFLRFLRDKNFCIFAKKNLQKL
jgi:hypothetical protein